MHYLILVLILSTSILSNVNGGDPKYSCDKDHNDPDANGGCDCTLDTIKWAGVDGNYIGG